MTKGFYVQCGCGVFAWLRVARLWRVVFAFQQEGSSAWLWRMLAIYADLGRLEGVAHGATGQEDMLRRWLVNLCLLTGPVAGWERTRKIPKAHQRRQAGEPPGGGCVLHAQDPQFDQTSNEAPDARGRAAACPGWLR